MEKNQGIGCHNSQAETYDDKVKRDSLNKSNYIREKYFEVHDKIIELAQLNNGQKLLDIGIGTGLLEEKISDNVEIHGVDISEKMLMKVQEKDLDINLKAGHFCDLPYEDNIFDRIVSCFAFHHLTDEEKMHAIREMNRVLRENGRIVIGDFMYLDDNGKKELIDKFKNENQSDMIEEMEEENFSNIQRLKQWFSEIGYLFIEERVSTISWVICAFKEVRTSTQ